MPDHGRIALDGAVSVPVGIDHEKDAVIARIVGQNVAVDHLAERRGRDLGIGGFQRVLPVAVVPPAVQPHGEDLLQIFGMPFQLGRRERRIRALVRMVVEDRQHAGFVCVCEEAPHIREVVRRDVIARPVLRRAPLGVDDEHVEREAVCTVVCNNVLIVGGGPVLIAAVP